MTAKNIRVIFDTNVWISFLIGKRLSSIQKYKSSGEIIIVITEQLLKEIKEVTDRDTLKKYFSREKVVQLIELLETISEKVEIKQTHFISRDLKDNFLSDLIYFSKADYLVTGDKVQNFFETAAILTPSDFEKTVNSK